MSGGQSVYVENCHMCTYLGSDSGDGLFEQRRINTLLFCLKLPNNSVNFEEVFPFFAATPEWVTAL